MRFAFETNASDVRLERGRMRGTWRPSMHLNSRKKNDENPAALLRGEVGGIEWISEWKSHETRSCIDLSQIVSHWSRMDYSSCMSRSYRRRWTSPLIRSNSDADKFHFNHFTLSLSLSSQREVIVELSPRQTASLITARYPLKAKAAWVRRTELNGLNRGGRAAHIRIM